MGDHELRQKQLVFISNDVGVNAILWSMFKEKNPSKVVFFVKAKQSQNFKIVHGS